MHIKIYNNDLRFLSTIRLRNDLYCVEWGVKLYSLTHSFQQPLACTLPQLLRIPILAKLIVVFLYTTYGALSSRPFSDKPNFHHVDFATTCRDVSCLVDFRIPFTRHDTTRLTRNF